MLASNLMSVQICSNSEIKVSDILKCFNKSSLLKLPRKTSSPPKDCNSRSNRSFHFPWFSESKYFVIQFDLRALLNSLMSIILSPPLL